MESCYYTNKIVKAVFYCSALLVPISGRCVSTKAELFVPLAANNPSVEVSQDVMIGAPLQGKNVKDNYGDFSQGEINVKGKIIYAFDTFGYDEHSKQSWNSYLVMRRLNPPANVLDVAKESLYSVSYPVHIPKGDFLYEPQFAPNGNVVAFKVGNPNSIFGKYDLYVWNLKTQQVQKLSEQRLSYRLIFWSMDSRYLAYVQGAAMSSAGEWDVPKLLVYDVRTRRNCPVLGKEPLANTMSWNSRGTLLFSAVSPILSSTRPALQGMVTNAHTYPQWPDTYEITAKGGYPKVLSRNSYKTVSSPNGKWLAFLSLEVPRKLKSSKAMIELGQSFSLIEPKKVFLTLSNPLGGERKFLRRELAPGAVDLMWAPDSRHLITIKRSSTKQNVIKVTVDQFDVLTFKEKRTADFDYQVHVGMDLTADNLLFHPLAISQGSTRLLFSLLQFEEPPNNGLFMKALDLNDGSISTLCRIGSVSGLDWHDESQPRPTPQSTFRPSTMKKPPLQQPRSSSKPTPRKLQPPTSAKPAAR